MRQLSDGERSQLAQTLNTGGWRLVQEIMNDAIETFNKNLITTSPHESDAVLVNHATYVAAAAFYNLMLATLTAEMQRFQQTDLPEYQPDITESILN